MKITTLDIKRTNRYSKLTKAPKLRYLGVVHQACDSQFQSAKVQRNMVQNRSLVKPKVKRNVLVQGKKKKKKKPEEKIHKNF